MRSTRPWLVAALGVLLLTVPAQAQVHTPNDHIPDFCASPTISSSAGSGRWSSPATWSPARVPLTTDRVAVAPGTVVTFDVQHGAAIRCVGIHGELRFDTAIDTRLWAGEVLVYAGGHLQIGTAAQPVPAARRAEIVIASKALDPGADPDQYGTGLVAWGKVTIHGAAKQPTFVRAASEPRAGHTVLQLEQPVTGWRPGDRLFVPDSRQVDENNKFNPGHVLHIDQVTVQSVSSDGRSVTVSPALQYDHRGARDADTTPTVLSDGTRLRPHVGNLTRNVVIRSENPAGTRGHTLFTHRADVRIHYAQFQDLGRTLAEPLHSVTNHIGRYPLHVHHVWGPVNPSNTGYQFELVGNAVNDSRKWPVAIHGSHYGLIKWNVVFGGSQLTGAGLAVEDGSETENLIEENFVANVRGDINPRESAPDTANGTTPGSAAECFWAAGFNNRYVNNVASDCRNWFQQIVSGPGWKFIVPAAPYSTRNPRFRGADMTSSAETVVVTPQRQSLLEFRRNEVYGGSAAGLTIWNLGTDGYDRPTVPESIVQDFRVWHTYQAAVWNYPVNRVTIDELVYRIDPSTVLYWEAAVQSGDYRDIDLTIRGGSIHAGGVFGGTVAPLGTIRIENVRAVTRGHAFSFVTPETPGTGAGIPDPPGITVILQDNVITPWPGQPLRTIGMEFQSGPSAYPNVRYEVFVYGYQGQAGRNLRVYWHEQATQNIAGGRAPCTDTTTYPEIDGITCPLTEGPGTVPAPPSGLVIR
jgi:G8 domain